MIISEKEPVVEEPNVSEESPPPKYTAQNTPSPPIPTNFVSLIRTHDSIHQKFLIDASLRPPGAPSVDVGPAELQPNLKLETIHGAITANIELIPQVANVGSQTRSGVRKTVTINAQSKYGSVNLRIHGSILRPPFELFVSSKNGGVTLIISRCFHGPINVSSRRGSVGFSERLMPYITPLGEAGKNRMYFIGNLSTWESTLGDKIEIEARYGGVRIGYEDEEGKVSNRADRPTTHRRIGASLLTWIAGI